GGGGGVIEGQMDRGASCVWLERPAGLPRKAVGFDFDGAPFTHVEGLVTFEVLLRSFGLEADGALRRVADVVHYLDVGGIPAGDAPGVAAILAGARRRSRDDGQLLKHALAVFDCLYAGYAERGE